MFILLVDKELAGLQLLLISLCGKMKYYEIKERI